MNDYDEDVLCLRQTNERESEQRAALDLEWVTHDQPGELASERLAKGLIARAEIHDGQRNTLGIDSNRPSALPLIGDVTRPQHTVALDDGIDRRLKGRHVRTPWPEERAVTVTVLRIEQERELIVRRLPDKLHCPGRRGRPVRTTLAAQQVDDGLTLMLERRPPSGGHLRMPRIE